MASKFEILGSVIQREHEALSAESGYIDDNNWMVVLHVLRVLHEAEASGEAVLADDIYEQIAYNYNVVDFSQDPPYTYDRNRSEGAASA